jgi:hypothetical protein
MPTVDLRNFMHDPFLPVSNKEAECLSSYLGFDNWTVEEAICILCRIDPDNSDMTWSKDDKPHLISLNSYQPFSRDRTIIAQEKNNKSDMDLLITTDKDCVLIKEMESKIRRYRRLWNSGSQRRKSNPPVEYIEWAKRHNLQIEWLDWAITTGRFKDLKGSKNKSSDRKSIQYEENLEGLRGEIALKIIGGLLIKGYRVKIHETPLKGFQEVFDDLKEAGIEISEKTLRSWIKDAAEVTPKLY